MFLSWTTVRYAIRALSRDWYFALSAVAVLGVGVGASTSVFTLIQPVLLTRLPFREPKQLVQVENHGAFRSEVLSRAGFYDSAAWPRSLGKVTQWSISSLNIAYRDTPWRVRGGEVSSAFFDVLGASIRIGRGFRHDEDVPGRDGVVVLSHRLWQRMFHGDLSVVGRTVSLSGLPFIVVGVASDQMRYPENVDLWTPTIFDPSGLVREDRQRYVCVVARIRPGVTFSGAAAEVRKMGRGGHETDSVAREDAPYLRLLAESLTARLRPAAVLLGASVLAVLLISCANLSHLNLVRVIRRRREYGVRAALGASNWNLLRQELVESAILAFGGGVAAIGVANWGVTVMFRFHPASMDQFPQPAVNFQALAVAAMLAVVTALLSNVVPVWFSARHSPLWLMQFDVPHNALHTRRAFRVLVVTQIAFGIGLLVTAFQFIDSLKRIKAELFPYDARALVSFSLAPHGAPYADARAGVAYPDKMVALYTRILEEIRDLANVTSAAIVDELPLESDQDIQYPIIPEDSPIRTVSVMPRLVSPGLFRTLGIRMLAGRDFDNKDALDADTKVAIISSNLAERFWPGKTALGRQLVLPIFGYKYVIVGIVQTPQRVPRGAIYLSLAQAYCPSVTFIVRVRQAPLALLGRIRELVRRTDTGQPTFDLNTVDQRIADFQSVQHFGFRILSAFAAMSVILASVGLFSVMSYVVLQRSREFAIRVALGAESKEVALRVFCEAWRLTLIGSACGILLALASVRLVQATLFHAVTVRPITLASATVLFWTIATVSCYLPARRAARADRLITLRGN